MKKLLILFSALLITFCGVWVFKSKSPTNRPDNTISVAAASWWNAEVSIEADDDWVLDPEIPENYIPVPGEKELYMVVDNNGKITSYRQRTQQEDGTWVWKTVNPDIPDNYEAVSGLEDVYKVVNKDGSISYFKYIRNEDDTFAFVPVDENGNPLEKAPEGSDIPDNYVRVSGNIYAVYDENGVIIGYKERKVDKDGNYYWVDAEKPEETQSSGTSYNSGNSSDSGSSDSVVDLPIYDFSGGQISSSTDNSNNKPQNNSNSGGEVISNGNGTYTQTETLVTTETKGGWVITYQTVITKTYSNAGELISTKKDGPTEISRVQATNSDGKTPDKNDIASTLQAEYARVNVGLNYNTTLASEVVTQINTERTAAGLAPLTLSTNNDEGMISAIRAADMAIYNHSDYDSAMYGDLYEMCEMFGVSCSAPSEIVWRSAGDKNATAIASRLQLMSNGCLTSGDYNSIGLSIVSKGGYYYIDAVLL